MNTENNIVKIKSNRVSPTNFSRELEFDGELADYIFSKEFQKVPLPYWESPDVQAHHDTYNKYTLNSYNCRGPEPRSGVDFITAGCSVTFGVGVPDNGVWPHFFAQEMSGSYVNLGASGASIEWVVDSIFRYIHTFGPPNRGVVVLFPDHFRVDLLVNNDTNSCDQTGPRDFVPQYYNSDRKTRLVSYHQFGEDPPKFLKRPYPVEYTSIPEDAIFRAIKAIKSLEIFCAQLKIPLGWSSWSDSINSIAIHSPYKFDNFIRLYGMAEWMSHRRELEKTESDPEGIVDYILTSHTKESSLLSGCSDELHERDKCVCHTKCHFEFENDYKLSFHVGTDRFKNTGSSHIGVHRHMHIAEDFVSKFKEMEI